MKNLVIKLKKKSIDQIMRTTKSWEQYVAPIYWKAWTRRNRGHNNFMSQKRDWKIITISERTYVTWILWFSQKYLHLTLKHGHWYDNLDTTLKEAILVIEMSQPLDTHQQATQTCPCNTGENRKIYWYHFQIKETIYAWIITITNNIVFYHKKIIYWQVNWKKLGFLNNVWLWMRS